MSSSSNKDKGISIVSNNNFPTAAGLASSASGYACLTAAVAKLLEVNVGPEALSRVARWAMNALLERLYVQPPLARMESTRRGLIGQDFLPL